MSTVGSPSTIHSASCQPAPPAAVPQGRPPTAAFAAPPAGSPPQRPSVPQLPPTGLPPGWTMEQWQHYGHQWLAQQGQQ